MNRDLFLAILAMDSYNRDYGAGVNITGSSLGEANILSRDGLNITAAEYDAWQAAGFYAIAYDMTGVAGFADGERVISYRGTDNPSTDILNGYGVAFGGPEGPQALLALELR